MPYIFGGGCPKNVISEPFYAFNVCTYYKRDFNLTCPWALLSVTIGFFSIKVFSVNVRLKQETIALLERFFKSWKDSKLTYLEQTGF